ncbi:MAG: type II toxin-antitoxin system YafQ family toxin [Chloroflexi bacterium]|nr:type II toxin-antitoxin system YafQ family toxin [Chloroflexota bacterium]
MRSIYHYTQFKKDYKLMGKRKLAIEELDNVIEMLANDEPLDVKYCDHPLQGDKKNTRGCHIQNDWVLFYIKKGKDELQLVRTGTHADLFG